MIKKMLALSLAASFAMTSFAQNENMEAFKHLGVGMEIGVMGAGIQFSMPVVDNHLVAVVGYNSYALYGLDKIDYDFELSSGRINTGIRDLNKKIDEHNAKPENAGAQLDKVSSTLPETFNIALNGKMGPNVKVLLEWYPSERRSFHLTGGLMMGSKSFISLSGDADDNVQRVYSEAVRVQTQAQKVGAIAESDNFIYNNLSYSVDGKTYAIKERVKVSSDINIMAVKPYLGIGFGSSVPKKRVGFQFEIGAWYHGGFTIDSDNEVEYDKFADVNEDVDKVIKNVKGLAVWPQMTFRLTGRIF